MAFYYTKAVLIVASIGFATSLKCYTCTDGAVGELTNTPACRDPFERPPTHAFVLGVDCTNLSRIAPEATAKAGIGQYNTCMKAISGDSLISRTCFDNIKCPERNGCYGDRAGTIICCCDTDYCNAGATVAFNMAVISVVVVTTCLLIV